jgi:hypothetical protein
MNSVVSEFINKVSHINDPDYGDFMRKANAYLLEMKKELSPFPDHASHDMVDVMQSHIQFDPNGNVESTREMVLKEANDLAEHLEHVHN